MKKDIIRTSFDLSTETIEQADAIVQAAQLDSRKEAVGFSIRLMSQVVEAFRQGLRLMLVDKEGEKKEFKLDAPNVEPQPTERLVLARLSKETAHRLLAVTSQPSHPAGPVALRVAMAAVHPQGPHYIEASLLFHLIYWALRLNDAGFLALVRDVATSCVTTFGSFNDLLQTENLNPFLDFNCVEQQFLADEYHRERRRLLAS
jgi:hypothetical protein